MKQSLVPRGVPVRPGGSQQQSSNVSYYQQTPQFMIPPIAGAAASFASIENLQKNGAIDPVIPSHIHR